MTRVAMAVMAVVLHVVPVVAAQAPLPVLVRTDYAIGPGGKAMNIADVDGDLLPDLGVLGNNYYDMLPGLGGGVLGTPVASTPSGAGAFVVTLADLDGDGRADRLRQSYFSLLFVDKSLGLGTFQETAQILLKDCSMDAVSTDLNGDGHADYLLYYGDDFFGPTPGLVTLLGSGTGTLSNQSVLVIGGDSPVAVVAGDLDGDGFADAVCTDWAGTMYFAHGNGDGSLSFAGFLCLSGCRSPALADVDADGWMDVVCVTNNGGISAVTVFRNEGGGVFGAPLPTGQTGLAHSLALADYNGDGNVDVGAYRLREMAISLGNGDGSFQFPLVYPVGGNPLDIKTADLDRNGSADLLVLGTQSEIVSVFLNQLPVFPWSTVGPGLPGSSGTPKLSAAGTLLAGDPVTLTLTHAAPSVPALLVIGLEQFSAPFKGGVLVPVPLIVLPALSTDAGGALVITGNLPAGLPANTRLYMQDWIVDAGGPQGFAASNAIVGVAP